MAFWQDGGSTTLLARTSPPIIAAAMMWVLLQLPGELIEFFTVWLLASFPIGILIGHGVLNGDPIERGL